MDVPFLRRGNEPRRRQTIVTALVARYGIGKDLVTHYKESVNGVTAARITEMLSALAAGSTAEIVIE